MTAPSPRAKPSTPTRTATDEGRGEAMLAEAERAVKHALARGAQQAEAFWEGGAALQVELENNRIANTGASQGSGASIRVVADGRVGFAYYTRPDQLDGAVTQALAQARHAPAKGYSLPSAPKPGRLDGRWDDRIAALSVEDAIHVARDILAGAAEGAPKATLAGGGVQLESGSMALASSQGIACWDRWTQMSCGGSLVLADGERSVSASESRDSHRFGLDGHAIALEAATTVKSLVGPKPATGGRLDVLFRPEAVAELVVDLAIAAATGDEARRGKTVWSERLGQPVAAPGLDLRDDSTFPGAIGGAPFDDEGLPTTEPLRILDDGVLRNFLYDSWDAHEHKAKSTCSAVRGGFKSRPGTGTHHLVLSSSKSRPTQTLVSGIDDGYLVESVLGAHTANATTGDFSVTAPNVWRILNGAVAGPAGEIAIGGNLPDLLLRLDGIGTEAKSMDGLRIPALRFRAVDVSA
ncbi:MAG TPA: TldD/PmbA family protein [Candidatus Thermoplasmatota archaeon]|nr:TldD/PmbA family protein [Candidatus Thermoplasmatota archaeon]